ncbi:unnamed protein product, partial [Ceratitis capitata]
PSDSKRKLHVAESKFPLNLERLTFHSLEFNRSMAYGQLYRYVYIHTYNSA